MIVLALGLLGMAGLQMSALRANDSAMLRVIATQASYDLIDRLRADPAAVLGERGQQVVLPRSTCSNEPSDLWQRDFCAFGLPAPSTEPATEEEGEGGGEESETEEETIPGDSALVINCGSANACGSGNCDITVRWDDSRGDAAKGGGARNVVFRVCTRLPALPAH